MERWANPYMPVDAVSYTRMQSISPSQVNYGCGFVSVAAVFYF